MDNATLQQTIVKCLDDFKAQDIVALDVKEITNVTDTMIIATATSRRHAATIVEKLLAELRKQDIRPEYSDIKTDTDWQVLDFIDIVVHVMDADTRKLYDLEKLWQGTLQKRDSGAN